jgi:hypothetical protein
VEEGDEVFELRLDDFVGALSLMCYGVISDVALAVDLESKGISG